MNPLEVAFEKHFSIQSIQYSEIPKQLPQTPAELKTILGRLLQLVQSIQLKYPDDYVCSRNLKMREASAVGIGWVLEEYLSKGQAALLSEQISQMTASWWRNLLRLPTTASALFQLDQEAGRLLACKAALHTAYPNLGANGWFSGDEKMSIPVIYTTLPLDSAQRLRLSLSLPSNSLRGDIGSSSLGFNIIDLESLEKAITVFFKNKKEDIKEGRRPTILILTIGVDGHIDQIAKIRKLCDTYNIWLHVEGSDGLPLLIVPNPPKNFAGIQQCDSISVSPGEWYGVGFTNTCTFFKEKLPPSMQYLLSSSRLFVSLPLWIQLQQLGTNFMKDSIVKTTQLTKLMYNTLSKIPSISFDTIEPHLDLVFNWNLGIEPFTEAISRDFDIWSKINKQLYLNLEETCQKLSISSRLDNGRFQFRFRPLLHPDVWTLESPIIDQFSSLLSIQVSLINQTFEYQPFFKKCVCSDQQTSPNLGQEKETSSQGEHPQKSTSSELMYVTAIDFVGLGSVRFTPSFLHGRKLSEDIQKELNTLNTTLAKQLNQLDAIFQQGKTSLGDVCVCVGVDTRPLNESRVQGFVEIIAKIAKDLQFGEKLTEHFSNDIAKRIKEAEEMIKNESANADYSEATQGLIRKIPIVGSVWGWWSPYKKTEVIGKTYDLSAQSLDSPKVSPSPQKPNNPPPSPPSSESQEKDKNNKVNRRLEFGGGEPKSTGGSTQINP